MLSPLAAAAQWMAETLRRDDKPLLCTNRGSAAEFVGRFERKCRALPAITLTTDTSILTALGNDYGTEVIFAQQVEALGQSSDLALAYSTSGARRTY